MVYIIKTRAISLCDDIPSFVFIMRTGSSSYVNRSLTLGNVESLGRGCLCRFAQGYHVRRAAILHHVRRQVSFRLADVTAAFAVAVAVAAAVARAWVVTFDRHILGFL